LPSKIYDMHCHLHEFSDDSIHKLFDEARNITVVAVSDDLESLLRTLKISEEYRDRIIVCAGFHPWNIGEKPISEVQEIIRIAYRHDLNCIGEVGLDLKFVPETISIQENVFKTFLKFASEVDAFLNIHAPNAWDRVLSLLIDFEIKRGLFHWYTGPHDLINVIGSSGLMISINPAVKIQKKHKRVVEETPLRLMVFESDGPYNYRGLKLNPLMIMDAMEEVAKIKNVSVTEVIHYAMINSEKVIGRVSS